MNKDIDIKKLAYIVIILYVVYYVYSLWTTQDKNTEVKETYKDVNGESKKLCAQESINKGYTDYIFGVPAKTFM